MAAENFQVIENTLQYYRFFFYFICSNITVNATLMGIHNFLQNPKWQCT